MHIRMYTRAARVHTHTHTHVDRACIGDEVSYPRRKRQAAQEIRARPLYSVIAGMTLHPLQHLHESTVIGDHLFDVIAGGCQLEQLPHDSLLHLCVYVPHVKNMYLGHLPQGLPHSLALCCCPVTRLGRNLS